MLHGHAHAGSERGWTEGGIEDRNVAQPMLGRPYNIYCLRRPPVSGANELLETSTPR